MDIESQPIYGYFRNGGILVTPSLELAWKRCTRSEPFVVVTEEGMRINPDLYPK
jgi:hypothetical protein